MQVYGPVQVHGAQGVNAPHHARPAASVERTQSAAIQDELQISDAARIAERGGSASEIRYDRVAEIRAQLADGTYETPEKLDLALDRLLDEIG